MSGVRNVRLCLQITPEALKRRCRWVCSCRRRPYLCNTMMSDVLLIAHDAQLPAHRLLLAASPKFAAMLTESLKGRRSTNGRCMVSGVWAYASTMRVGSIYLPSGHRPRGSLAERLPSTL
jgi:hypothetical protein